MMKDIDAATAANRPADQLHIQLGCCMISFIDDFWSGLAFLDQGFLCLKCEWHQKKQIVAAADEQALTHCHISGSSCAAC